MFDLLSDLFTKHLVIKSLVENIIVGLDIDE